MTRRDRAAPIAMDIRDRLGAVLFEARSRRRRWMVLSLHGAVGVGAWDRGSVRWVDHDPRRERRSRKVVFGDRGGFIDGSSGGAESPFDWTILSTVDGIVRVQGIERALPVSRHGWVLALHAPSVGDHQVSVLRGPSHPVVGYMASGELIEDRCFQPL